MIFALNFVYHKCLLGCGWKKYKIAKNLQCETLKEGLKGLYHQIYLVNHTMHTHDEWNILTLDPNSNSKGIHPINTKTYELWSKFLFFQTPLCHQKVHNQQS